MVTYHVAKFDCFKSSRVTMQAKWDVETKYIHRSSRKASFAFPLEWKTLKFSIKDSSPEDRFIFHAQSSIIYLIVAKLFLGLKFGQCIFDIHDLNVIPRRWDYLKLRAIVLTFLEWFVLRILKTKSTTVSKGISIIIAKKYAVERPLIVRNISAEVVIKDKNRPQQKLVYFGTLNRLPVSFFTDLEKDSLTIDVFGRFNNDEENKALSNAIAKGYVNFKGAYDPKDLSFLYNYEFLYYNIIPYDTNYRFAGPNKFFQALCHGLKILIPPGYSELLYLLSPFPDTYRVIKGSVAEIIASDYPSKDCIDIDNLDSYLHALKNESKENYKRVLYR